MQIQPIHQDPSKHRDSAARHALQSWKAPVIAGWIALASSPGFAGSPPQGPTQVQPRPIVIPNRTLDPHELKELELKNSKRRNLDAENAARKRVIDDETNKLLILARDLKAKADRIGSGALTTTMVREAEVIEVLAKDVQEEMKLTVSAE